MAGTTLGTAYVQIMPSAKGVSSAISKELGGESTAAGNTAGLNIVGAIKKVIAAAGIGTFLKSALDAGGDLQQSFGGLETIYGEAADAAKDYAAEAAKAGISANDYAEQCVGFGAALKQAFGGDTTKAVEAANTAILDMADNSAKMGTDIGSIQAAYAGFARGQYTLLDNLKIGYGGTKSEMERLLKDAQAISGVEYNIDNLGDVYSAIHVIQENLGLTGVAAQEASTTFSGSMQAMKASAQNVLANLALGESISAPLDTLLGSVRTFLVGNLIPMVGNVLKGLPDLLSGAARFAIQSMMDISKYSADIVSFVTGLISKIIKRAGSMAPFLIEGAVKMISSLSQAILSTDWMGLVTGILNSIKSSIADAGPQILGTDSGIVSAIFDSITAGLPEFLEMGTTIITNIANGILAAVPGLIETLSTLLQNATEFILANGPVIVEAGMDLIVKLADGVLAAMPDAINSLGEVVTNLLKYISDHLPDMVQSGQDIIQKIGEGIRKLFSHLPEILKAIGQTALNMFKAIDWVGLGKAVITLIWSAIKMVGSLIWDALAAIGETAYNFFKDIDWYGLGYDFVTFILNGIKNIANEIPKQLKEIGHTAMDWFKSIDWWGLGRNIIDGIVNGIKWAGGAIRDTLMQFAWGAWDAVKSFFGISSPSKLMRDSVGKWIPLGIAEGIDDEASSVTKSLDALAMDAVNGFDANVSMNGAVSGMMANGMQDNSQIVVNVYPSAGMNEKQLAERVSQQLALAQRQKMAAWGAV